MDRRPLAEDRLEVGRRELGGVERADALAQDERTRERLLHRHLLVEDEAQVRQVAAETLRDLGYQVLEASTGAAALQLLQDRTRRVDILVTDVGLPGGLNGRQVADAARLTRPKLPVLFITGFAGKALQERLAPEMAVIGKPFPLDTLATTISSMLQDPAGIPQR